MKSLSLFSLIFFVLFSSTLFAEQSNDGIWSDVSASSVPNLQSQLIRPIQFRTLQLNVEQLTALLHNAPMENSVSLRHSPTIINLPLPNGGFGRFRFVESPIMAPELLVKYPETRTYLGQGIDDRTATVRFDITPVGFHAMILSSGSTIYIDPYAKGNTELYMSYFKHAVISDESRRFEELGIIDPHNEMANEIARLMENGTPKQIGEQLRTYRLALACTGEYATYHGGTKPLVHAAMVTAMNRVDGVYEREVSVRMVLIANNDTLIYLNASSDPYTNNNGYTMLGQNQTTLDNIIGTANYDMGHVFSTGGGGVAGLGVICRAGNKARGVTGLTSPIGDPFYIDYVAHEMGHQFGGNHTFNSASGSCAGGNRNGGTAYEPGSGSTIMAYAGICSPDDLQTHSDDYFHGISLDEIITYTTAGSGNNCPVVTQTGNHPPIATIPSANRNIPLSTSFYLTGSGSDPDTDAITFCWEEFDLGPAGSPGSPSGNAAILRSFKGTENPTRIFPKLSNILSNTQTIGEILPSYARTMNFRLYVRDNRANGGGSGKASTTVIAVANTGPFAITYPNTSVTWLMNSVDTVKWNVANTTASPINCSSVRILLSTDGGQTFSTTLAESTANDGNEAVNVPNIATTTARIKIEALGNIFFDISNLNFSFGSVATPSLVSPANASTNQPLPVTILWRTVANATLYHIQVSTTTSFNNLLVNDSTLTDTSRIVTGLSNNIIYYWRAKAKNENGASGWSDVWSFRFVPLPPSAPSLFAPTNNTINLAPTVTMRWSITSATSYRLEVSEDSLFSVPVVDDTTITTTQKTVTFNTGKKYYWRVRGKNSGGYGTPSAVWNFSTQQLPAQIVLISPPNGSTVEDDLGAGLFWHSGGTSGERYWLEISNDSLFTTSVIDSAVTDSMKFVTSLQSNHFYWWRVKAKNNAGWGDFSEAWRFFIILASVPSTSQKPYQFLLEQNFPNPFNPLTIFKFQLPISSHTTLKIYNILGEEVATLVNETLPARNYEREWDATNFSSGLYFYRLTAGKFSETKKLLLLK